MDILSQIKPLPTHEQYQKCMFQLFHNWNKNSDWYWLIFLIQYSYPLNLIWPKWIGWINYLVKLWSILALNWYKYRGYGVENIFQTLPQSLSKNKCEK